VRVSGEIRFPSLKRALSDLAIRIRVDDVTRAGAAARTAAVKLIRVSTDPAAPAAIRYFVEIPDERVDARARYVVAAHTDLDGDGQLSRGDFTTTASHPVLTQGYSDTANLDLYEIE
jgi:Type III secretion system lipoprotein chaperone (YscW)